jgi:hypothetical protein
VLAVVNRRQQFVVLLGFRIRLRCGLDALHWCNDLATDATRLHYAIRLSIFMVRCEPQARGRLRS